MGTSYKGYSPVYRAVGDNIKRVATVFDYKNGFFGNNSSHGRKSTRNIIANDVIAVAKDFYEKITYGGLERKINDNMKITRMADGTIITIRKVSHSDGTPAIDINITKSVDAGGLKTQKIHCVKEK